MADQWAWWRASVEAGKPQPITEAVIESGFYKTRTSKGASFQPVAIWREDGKAMGLLGPKGGSFSLSETDLAARWLFIAKHPIPHDEYKAMYAGTSSPAPSNLPSDPYEAWKAEIDDKVASVREWMATTPIDDKPKADRARNSQSEILALIKRGEGMHKDEKAPILKAERETDAKYLPMCKGAKEVADRLRHLYGAFAAAEEARLRAEAQARFDAERKAAEAERARIAAEQEKLMAEDPIAALTSLPPELPAVPVAPEPVKVNVGGGVGRAAGLKTEWDVEFTDYGLAVQHFMGHPDVQALIGKLAKSAVKTAKGSIEIPGVRNVSRRVAA